MKLKQTILLTILGLLSAGNARAMDRDFKSKVKPFFRLHCIRCHGPDREEGGIRVDKISGDLDDLNSIDALQNILDEITVGSMPPASEPTPSDQALKNITRVISKHIAEDSIKVSGGLCRKVWKLADPLAGFVSYDS